MNKNLVIVESPAKAKTISKYLGKGFTVLSSIGHIRNIAKKVKNKQPPIDTANKYTTIYEIDSDKKKVIKELKQATKQAETVWLATDEDREGEAIAWHLCEVLGLDLKKTKRIVFHEITENAIKEAIKNPRTIDMDLVQAQQARQILDRLVGFELSPVVWQKVPGGKSAGRVQSPTVRLLVEKEREIDSFNSLASFKIWAEFNCNGQLLKAELTDKIDSELEAKKLLEKLLDIELKVSNITTSPINKNPSPPFTTSTLQQEANKKLNFSTKATMASAQKLYQAGKITYMRTDSVNLSNPAIASIANFIDENFGSNYVSVKKFKNKSANAQEAHEAIRPTDIKQTKASSNEYDQKLYNLIRQRTLASQMAGAKLEKTVIEIADKDLEIRFKAKGEKVIFDGFLKAYQLANKEEVNLPTVDIGQIVNLTWAKAQQTFSRSPARYSEGSLVKKLEDLGIGRPSTYATIINNIQARNYAQKGQSEGQDRPVIMLEITKQAPIVKREIINEKTGSDKGKLIPTHIGEVLSDFLLKYFNLVVDYGFTAKAELGLDKIASGKIERNKIIDDIYKPFHKLIEGAKDIDRSSVSQTREIGLDPKTGKTIIARFGRFGPMLQIGDNSEADKPKFAPLPKGYKIDNITLEAALKAFELPRLIGQTESGETIKANIGRFGPYIQVGSKFISIKQLDPHTIELKEALSIYKEKLKSEAEKQIADFGEIKILKGRFGPYITDGTKNAKIAKDLDPTKIDEVQAKQILKDHKKTRRNFKTKNK